MWYRSAKWKLKWNLKCWHRSEKYLNPPKLARNSQTVRRSAIVGQAALSTEICGVPHICPTVCSHSSFLIYCSSKALPLKTNPCFKHNPDTLLFIIIFFLQRYNHKTQEFSHQEQKRLIWPESQFQRLQGELRKSVTWQLSNPGAHPCFVCTV